MVIKVFGQCPVCQFFCATHLSSITKIIRIMLKTVFCCIFYSILLTNIEVSFTQNSPMSSPFVYFGLESPLVCCSFSQLESKALRHRHFVDWGRWAYLSGSMQHRTEFLARDDVNVFSNNVSFL